jgi:hypothetical protein
LLIEFRVFENSGCAILRQLDENFISSDLKFVLRGVCHGDEEIFKEPIELAVRNSTLIDFRLLGKL